MAGKLVLTVPGGTIVAMNHQGAIIRVQRHPKHHERLIIHAPPSVAVAGVPVSGVAFANIHRLLDLRPVTIAHRGEEIHLYRGQRGADKIAFDGPLSFHIENKAG